MWIQILIYPYERNPFTRQKPMEMKNPHKELFFWYALEKGDFRFSLVINSLSPIINSKLVEGPSGKMKLWKAMDYSTMSKSLQFQDDSLLLCSRLDNKDLKEKRSQKTHFTNPKDHSQDRKRIPFTRSTQRNCSKK